MCSPRRLPSSRYNVLSICHIYPPPHTIIPLYTIAYERGSIFKAYLNQYYHVATESTTAPSSPSSSTNTTTLVCPAGKIHTMCGPRCHVFCGGRRECQSRNCVEGCFCDSDMVELGETCVRPEDCPVPGTCTINLSHYFS